MTSLFTLIGMGFDFIVIVSLLLFAAASSLSLDMEYLLLGSSAPFNGCSAVSCDFGALAGEDKCIFCCTVFNWRLLISFY